MCHPSAVRRAVLPPAPGAGTRLRICEHKIGVSVGLTNWGWCFARHLRRGGWCFGVVWEGEAELVRPPTTGSLESQWALEATLTPWHAQRQHPWHGTAPSSVPSPASARGAAALCAEGSPPAVPQRGQRCFSSGFPVSLLAQSSSHLLGGERMEISLQHVSAAAPQGPQHLELLYGRADARKNIHGGLFWQRLTAG